MAEAPGSRLASRVGSSWPSPRAPWSEMWCGWAPGQAKCGAQRTLALRGSGPADWRHCPRRRNGRSAETGHSSRSLNLVPPTRTGTTLGRDRGRRARVRDRWRPHLARPRPRRTVGHHELAVHRNAPDSLRVSAGDGYFESDDAGATWRSPSAGLEVGYLRSLAIDPGQPEVVVVSASSGPHSAYVAGRSDGRLYRRLALERWERVRDGWPEPASTIAPLLRRREGGELWAADERGVHRSDDGGKSWRRVVSYATSPQHVRGLSLVV